MKKIFTLILVLLSQVSFGQNLVPNPSFEIYSSCPAGPDEVYKATGWDAYKESPDYFNACATSSAFSVPTNQCGYQQAFSGNAYCGFFSFNYSNFYREIIGGQLSSTLIIGQKYFISFEVALDNNWGQCGTDKIGAKFSKVPFSFTSPVPINNTAHIYSPTIITDTANWTKITGTFIADSAYNYIMIGNFFDDVNTDTAQIWNYQYCTAYYFIDNVCVSTDSLTCNPIINGLYSLLNKNDFSIRVFPNPAKESMIIASNEAIKDITIKLYDLLLQSQAFNCMLLNDNSCLIKFNSTPNGIYFLSVISHNKKTITKKIIINN